MPTPNRNKWQLSLTPEDQDANLSRLDRAMWLGTAQFRAAVSRFSATTEAHLRDADIMDRLTFLTRTERDLT
jgi:hypothetical protein